MSSLGIILVLTAALCHATWNVFVKRVGGGPELIWLFSVVTIVIYAPLAIGIIVVERPVFGPLEATFIAGSAVLHLGYFLLLQRGYRVGDLSLVYPIARATGPIISTTLAILLLGESLSAQSAAGAAVIIASVFFLTGGNRSSGADGKAAASLLFGLAVGLLIGLYTVWDAYAVSVLAVPPLLLDYTSTACRALLLTPHARRNRDKIAVLWRDHRAAVLCIAIFTPLAYILVLYALTFTPVTYVAPLREVSVLLTVLAGSILLGEGRLARRLGWSVVILAGVVTLVTG